MIRKPDWRGQLSRYIEHTKVLPFEWGELDCGLFAAGAVEAMTGVDVAANLRRKYTNMAEFQNLLKIRGYTDYAAFVGEHFERVSPSPVFAQHGDIAAVNTPDGIALGIVGGSEIFVMMQTGLGVVPLTDAKRAWRV